MQTIVTRFHAPTQRLGARLSATSTAGHRVMIPYPHDPVGTEAKHAHAVRALARQIGNPWPTSRMVGGTLNARGDMVWVFINGSPRT